MYCNYINSYCNLLVVLETFISPTKSTDSYCCPLPNCLWQLGSSA